MNQDPLDSLDIAVAAANEAAAGPAVVRRMSDVMPERVEWVWPNRLPAGKLVILDGDPGLGKSVLTLDWSAHVTTGKLWPDGCPCPQGAVVLMSAEDGLADTIRPRLDAAGADCDRVVAFTDVRDQEGNRRLPTIPGDLPLLAQMVVRERALLVVVDVLMAYLDGRVNSHRDQDVRRALAPLADLAQTTGACIVVLRHLNKSTGGPALYRGGGSIGISGGARMGLLVGTDPNDDQRRILAVSKSNLAKRPPALAFALVETDQGAVAVDWLGPADYDADQLVAQLDEDDEPGLPDLIVKMLTDDGGCLEASKALKQLRGLGYAERTIQRARKKAGVRTEKSDFTGGWVWSLPWSLPQTESSS